MTERVESTQDHITLDDLIEEFSGVELNWPLEYNEETAKIFDRYMIAMFGPALKELAKH